MSIEYPHELIVNGRFLTQKVSGVQAFARGLVEELAMAMPRLPAGEAGMKIIVPQNTPRSREWWSDRMLFLGKGSGHWWEQTSLRSFARNNPDSVLLNLCNTAPMGISNQAVVIHDLAFFENPKWFHPAFAAWYRFLVPRIAKKSRLIITVSQTMKESIVEKLHVSPSRILVIGNKVSRRWLDEPAEENRDGRIEAGGFFLMVGSHDPRKNFQFVVDTFLKNKLPYKLVIAGGRSTNFRSSSIRESEKIILLNYTNPGLLKWLFSNAKALINPSLYEGFGIPNLEAMALRCPVLCSDIAVFHEVCSDAAVYFDPKNSDSLLSALELLNNQSLVSARTSRGSIIFTNFQNQDRSGKMIKALFP
jgi:glycosyltransferase involved in cell wall biosynthesis